MTSIASPYSAVAFVLSLSFIACLAVPWAMRLIIFGVLCARDVMLMPQAGRHIRSDEPQAFLMRDVGAACARTFGRIKRDGSGKVVFVYRPWLILPKRAVALPPENMVVAAGAMFPSLLCQSSEQEPGRRVAVFLPRYRSYEHQVASHLSVPGVRTASLLRKNSHRADKACGSAMADG